MQYTITKGRPPDLDSIMFRSSRQRGQRTSVGGKPPRSCALLHVGVAAMSSRRRRSRYHETNPPGPKCSYCERPLALFSHNITCAVCSQLVFCVDCFSVGANNNKTHKSTHPYMVEQRVSNPVYAEEWSAEDERKLLDALSKYGLDNWRKVANELGTHSAKRCEDHYYAVYINHENAPLPRELLEHSGSGNNDSSQATSSTPVATSRRRNIRDQEKLEDENEGDGDAKPGPSASVTKVARKNNANELTGYLPKRGDFEVEYDDKAEHLIADLEILEDDDEATIELKAQLIEIYDKRLRTREEVKNLVFETSVKCVEESPSTGVEQQAEKIMNCLRDSERRTRKSRRGSNANTTLSSEAPTPNGMEHDL